MIPRYSNEKISSIWSDKNRYEIWLKIEIYICEKLCIDKKIPKKDFLLIKNKPKIDVKDIEKLDEKTHHEVIAFLNSISKKVGKSSRYIHQGVTSSDIIDTAFSLQLKQATEIIISDLNNFLKVLKIKAKKYKKTICLGRTHGIHAEPTTFGLKIAGFYAEMERNLKRLKVALEDISVCAISGAVGTYATIDPSIEKFVAKKLNLKTEKVSTQIIPRDRHAHLFSIFAIIASSIERIVVEIRHLQRTEVNELQEYFSKKQKGSSAMPHKKNPILSENLTGLSRMVRSYVVPALENIALWHERDISHSSVERNIGPDANITLDFALVRLNNILNNMIIYPKKMISNLNITKGMIFSQEIMLELTKSGISREKSYEIIQSHAKRCFSQNLNLFEVIKKDKLIMDKISLNKLKKIFNYSAHFKNINLIFNRVFK